MPKIPELQQKHLDMLWERVEISVRTRTLPDCLFYLSRIVDNLLDFDHQVLPIIK